MVGGPVPYPWGCMPAGRGLNPRSTQSGDPLAPPHTRLEGEFTNFQISLSMLYEDRNSFYHRILVK